MKIILKKNMKLIFMMLTAVFFTSCESEDSFLESEYRGVVEPRLVNDYSLMLNASTSLIQPNDISFNGAPIELMSDNIYEEEQVSNQTAAAYAWAKQIYSGDDTPGAWVEPYKKIHIYNTVFNDIDKALDANDIEKKQLIKKYKAEALLGRASEHFFLVNLFSQPYSEANKSKPGIPYVEFADITKPIPPRETIEITYNKIEADILNAIPNLPNLSNNTSRGSKIGAYGMLSRMYLYKGEWDKALEYVQKALDIKSDYLDYATINGTEFFVLTDVQDNVYVTTNSNESDFFFRKKISSELNMLYNDFDYRKQVYYFDFFDLSPYYGYPSFTFNKGITIPELIVTKAELLVRKGTPESIQEGLDLINELTVKRSIVPIPYIAFDKETALTIVLEERRRELSIQGLRWFDMRRLDMEGRMGTVTHTNAFTGEVYSLEPGSPRYTLQIPSLIINQEGFEQNP